MMKNTQFARIVRRALAVLFALVAFPAFSEDARAPLSIKIDQIISRDYPDVVAYAIVKNSAGETVQGLSPGLFKFRIDSMEFRAKTAIVPFSMKETPIDYTILFSNNGIMDGEPLDFQKNAILQFIDSMKPADTLSLYTIGEEAVPVFEAQKKDAIDVALVSAVETAQTQPRVYDSLINLMRKVSRRDAPRKVLVVISDGRDQNSRFTKEQLNDVVVETGIPVYAIGIKVLSSQSLSNLDELAELTGGTYLFAPTLSELPACLKKINGFITQCYVITMRVKGLRADNLPHHLELVVDERDSYGKGQKTFIATRVPVPKWVKWVVAGVILLVIALIVLLAILHKIAERKRMGITKRRCPDCRHLMKDSWDSCPFCKYIPDLKKKKKRKKDKE
jgi:hypothetical protein